MRDDLYNPRAEGQSQSCSLEIELFRTAREGTAVLLLATPFPFPAID